MRNYVLLTGATGLLGQYLVRDMLKAGHRLAVLVRPTKKQTPVERIEQTMQMWERTLGEPLPRPVVIAGDITQEDLGLSADDRDWISANCTTMLHCAASLTFHEHNGEPWRTNIDGTRNVLQLCIDSKLSEMHYISTAYVCGHRHDLVKEDELDVGQEFRNDYEKSKFTAETLVRECPAFDSLTVYRPVVITGDGVTGYTSTYHGTYLYMKLASVLKGNTEPNENGEYHVPVRWGLTGDERRNITPVDWNSTIICKIFENPEAHGRTYHMAPSDPITMREAISYATDYYGLTGIEFRGFGQKPDQPLNEMERWLWSNISIYGSYDFMDPRFDTTNLKKFVPEPVCPKLDRDMALRLMKYAEEDRWGKRKPPKPEPGPVAMQDYLAAICQSGGNHDRETESQEYGLRMCGPDGGDWTVEVAGGEVSSFRRGLPANQAPVLQLTCQQFDELTGRGSEAASRLSELVGNGVILPDAAGLAEAVFKPTVEGPSA